MLFSLPIPAIRHTLPSPLIYHPNNWWVVLYKARSYSLCNFLQSPSTSSLLGLNIFLSTLLSNTLSFAETKFHTHIKQRAWFFFFSFRSSTFVYLKPRRQKILTRMAEDVLRIQSALNFFRIQLHNCRLWILNTACRFSTRVWVRVNRHNNELWY